VSFYPPVARPVQLTYSMRELLEKAHQQDDDDLFKEEEGDDEFAAPRKLSITLHEKKLTKQRRSVTSTSTNSPIQTTSMMMRKLKSEKSVERRNEKYVGLKVQYLISVERKE